MALDPNNLLSYSVWLGLPMETRWKIARLLNIPARGIKQVVDSRIICDGFIHEDLAMITKEKIREITKVRSDDYYVLFNALVEFVEGKLNVTEDVQQKEQAPEVRPIATKKRGRPAKRGK